MIKEQQALEIERQTLFNNVMKQIQKEGQDQLFHKVFLKPIEICLKTWKTQDQIQKIGSLPYGLKQILKLDISDNKYKTADFPSWDHYDKFDLDAQYIKENNCDNLISVIKGTNQSRIKLAICICMYSQDKAMLKKTLAGVRKNIIELVKNGTPSHEIIICVVMDGIQVIDQSVLDYFQELEKESGVYLADDYRQVTLEELLQPETEPEQLKNVSHFVFNTQLSDRKARRFTRRKAEYKKIKTMIKRIEQLEKDKAINFDSLDSFIQPFFYDVARQVHKQQTGGMKNSNLSKDQLRKLYTGITSISRPIIRKALINAKKYCIQYLKTRDDLALLNSFRIDIPIIEQQQQAQEKKETESSLSSSPSSFHREKAQQKTRIRETKMNLFFITKYRNRGKLSSHNWFFNGLCEELHPQFAVILDVGLVPENDAIYKMVNHMENNHKIGGVCGYMGLKLQKVGDAEQVEEDNIDSISSLCMKFFDIQRAQQVEYHLAHLIDKGFQSCFGFIHVLPGAFSAYRMKALKPSSTEDSELLRSYFSSLKQAANSGKIKTKQYGVFETVSKIALPQFISDLFVPVQQNTSERLLYDENVYLAEDRTLCLGIYLNGFGLQYLPDAYSWVDPIKTLYALLGQRKRWINGSNFAFAQVKNQLQKSEKKSCFLAIQILYLQLMTTIAFISPALFFLTTHLGIKAFLTDFISPFLKIFAINLGDNAISIIVSTIDFISIMIFLGLVLFSMHMKNKNPKLIPYIYSAATFYGLISLLIFFIIVWDIINGLIGQNSFLIENQLFQAVPNILVLINILKYLVIGIFILHIVPIIIYCLIFWRGSFIIDIVMSSTSSIFYSPTYLMILNIYSLCRIDDISWGTKGLSEAKGKAQSLTNNWKTVRTMQVSKYVLWNSIMTFIFLSFSDNGTLKFFLAFSVMIILTSTLFIKVIMSLIYMIRYQCSKIFSQRQNFSINSTDKVEQGYLIVRDSIIKEIKQTVFDFVQKNNQKNRNILCMAFGGPRNFNMLSDPQNIIKQKRKSFQKRVSSSYAYSQKHIDNEGLDQQSSIRQEQNIKNNVSTSGFAVIPLKKQPTPAKIKVGPNKFQIAGSQSLKNK